MPMSIRLKYSGGPKARANFARGGRHQHQADDRNRSGDERAEGGNPQRDAGPSLLGHLVSVQAGDDRGRLPGNVYQDGSGGPAIHRPVINSGEHDDGRNRGNVERVGEKKGNGRRRAQTRENADQGPHENPDEAEENIHRGKEDLGAQQNMIQKIHVLT